MHLSSEGLLSQGTGDACKMLSSLCHVLDNDMTHPRPACGHASQEIVHECPVEAATAGTIGLHGSKLLRLSGLAHKLASLVQCSDK